MVPLWLFLVVLVFGGLGWVALFLSGFPDPGFRIYTAPDDTRKELLLKFLAYYGGRGFGVKFRDDSPGIWRAFLWDGVTLVNSTTKKLFPDRHNPVFTIAIPARDPVAATEEAVMDLKQLKFRTAISRDVDPTVARMDMIAIDEFPGLGILFRPHIFRILLGKIRKAIGR